MSRYKDMLWFCLVMVSFTLATFPRVVNATTDPNASIALTKFEITKEKMLLEYEITNNSVKNIWVCTEVGAGAIWDSEVFAGYTEQVIHEYTKGVDQDIIAWRNFKAYNDDTLYIRKVITYLYIGNDILSHPQRTFNFTQLKPGETLFSAQVYEIPIQFQFVGFPGFLYPRSRKLMPQNLAVEVEYLVLPDNLERAIAKKRDEQIRSDSQPEAPYRVLFDLDTSMGRITYWENDDKAKLGVATTYDFEEVAHINPSFIKDTAEFRQYVAGLWKKNKGTEKILRLTISGVKIPYNDGFGYSDEEVEEWERDLAEEKGSANMKGRTS